MSKFMECTKCQNVSGTLDAYPFVIEETLLSNPYDHKDVYIHKCTGCCSFYVGVGIQAFDDNLSYWVRASSSEIVELQSIKQTPEVFKAAKQLIESKASHLYGDRDGRYYFRQESAVVLSGMPAW
jgi:hypothetical protein